MTSASSVVAWTHVANGTNFKPERSLNAAPPSKAHFHFMSTSIRKRGAPLTSAPLPADEPALIAGTVCDEVPAADEIIDETPKKFPALKPGWHPERPPPELAMAGTPIDDILKKVLKWVLVLWGAAIAYVYLYASGGLGKPPFPPPLEPLDEPLYASAELEIAGRFPKAPVGVAVADDGRIFAAFDGRSGSGDKIGCFDPRTGKYAPYPSARHQHRPNTPISLLIQNNVLHVLDHGSHVLASRAHIFRFNLTSDAVMGAVDLPQWYGARLAALTAVPNEADSTQGGTPPALEVLMADSSLVLGFPSLYVTNTSMYRDSRKLLFGHHTLGFGQYTLHSNHGKPLKWGIMGQFPYRPAVSSLAVSDDGWLYYASQSDTTLHRIPLSVVLDSKASKHEKAAQIQTVATNKPISGGMVYHEGLIYIADQQTSAIRVFDPSAPHILRTVVRDSVLLSWPEQLAIKDGYLYIARSELDAAMTGHKNKWHHEGAEELPGLVVRLKL
ncbi:hypothetical protein HDU87_004749 [Geranomyces variabilis]|uniref:Uncharacterized protein n=1 Tax=Geranomyces variabilis TaxID=109894 RepID=A0AAD5XRR2_9FUNG|nr:hypothetical protein HDU87_004749 [Geranomyces variabilis]